MPFVQELRSSLENPSTPISFPAEWLLDIFNGGRTDSGIRVSELTALQVTTVFACVQLISGAMGALDLLVYERTVSKDGRVGKRKAQEHDLYDLLEYEPNPEMTAFTFKKTLQCHALLWGNCYAEIQRDNANRVVALWPRNPARTRPYRLKNGTLIYKTTEGQEEITGTDGDDRSVPERIIEAQDMLHIPGLTIDGRVGQSVVNLARQAIGLSLATEKYGSKFFGNGARPAGILSHPAALSPAAKETLRRSWHEAQGGENAQKVAVLEEGLKWESVATPPNDSQFLETRQFQKTEICSVFLVAPHMIGDSQHQNRANTEQIGIEFVTFTMGSWTKPWQHEFKRKLFPRNGRNAGRFFAMFDTAPLVMPDAASRLAFYNAGKQWGWLSTNDIHERERINPVDDPSADAYWIPINMQDAAKAFREPAQGPGPADGNAGGDAPAADPAAKGAKNDNVSKRFVQVYYRLFRDAFGRVLAREKRDSDSFRKAFLPVLSTIAEQLSTMAAQEFDCEPVLDFEGSRFLLDYVEGMRTRSLAEVGGWRSDNADLHCDRELRRAVKAILIDVYRSVATAKAKTLGDSGAQPALEEATV